MSDRVSSLSSSQAWLRAGCRHLSPPTCLESCSTYLFRSRSSSPVGFQHKPRRAWARMGLQGVGAGGYGREWRPPPSSAPGFSGCVPRPARAPRWSAACSPSQGTGPQCHLALLRAEAHPREEKALEGGSERLLSLFKASIGLWSLGSTFLIDWHHQPWVPRQVYSLHHSITCSGPFLLQWMHLCPSLGTEHTSLRPSHTYCTHRVLILLDSSSPFPSCSIL